MRQIRHLREVLEEEAADIRIVAGDFNTLAPRALRHVHEKRVEQALGPQYINALPRLSWSYDTSHADPGDGFGFLNRNDAVFTNLIHSFGKLITDRGIRICSNGSYLCDFIFIFNGFG